MYKSYTVEEAKRKLEQYCAYQERCHDEVIKKLQGMNMIPQAVDAIVTHLIEHNFLNEERFACSFARGKFRIKHWGRERIVRELKFRNITRYNINKALQEIPQQDYYNAFHTLAESQWKKINEPNIYKKKQKLAGFLFRKGFESQMVYDKIADIT